MKPFITILGQKYSSYNMSIMVGIIFVIWLFYRFEKNISNAEKDNIISVLGFNLVAGFLSAMLGDKLMHFRSWDDFCKHLLQFTGMTFICGLIGGFIFFVAVYGMVCRDKKKIWLALNVITPYFILAQVFGRFGCLMGGCCFGKPADFIFGIRYPENSYAYREYGNIKLYPVPVMEMCLLLLILYFTVRVFINAKFVCYILMYSVGRFFLEYFRGDNRGNMYGGLSPSQIICIVVFFFAAFTACIFTYTRKKKLSLDRK